MQNIEGDCHKKAQKFLFGDYCARCASNAAKTRFMSIESQSPLACDMTAIPAAQRQTHLAASQELFSLIDDVRELPDGYEFLLAPRPDLIVRLAEFILLEKLCCPFLNFVIAVAAENGPVSLRLSGREGVKAFIREEISGFTGFTRFTPDAT